MTGWGGGKPRRGRKLKNWNNAVQLGLSPLGNERSIPTVSLPRFSFSDEPLDDRAKAEAIITIRIIRAGRDAYEAIAEAENFDAWLAIGKALSVGKAYALRASGANAPWGQHYCREFSKWAKETGFGTMRASDRSYAIALSENLGAITAWRAGLSDRERGRLTTAQSNVKRWRAETAGAAEHSPLSGAADLQRDALMHWRRFRLCLKALPRDQAADLWRTVSAEVEGLRHHTRACAYARVGTDVGMDTLPE
jgi:hypothetical protein